MNCPECNSKTLQGANFCAQCGGKTVQSNTPNSLTTHSSKPPTQHSHNNTLMSIAWSILKGIGWLITVPFRIFAGAALGTITGLVCGALLIVAGLALCATIIGAIAGIPMIITGFTWMVGGPFVGAGAGLFAKAPKK